jgi:hypothetical protein
MKPDTITTEEYREYLRTGKLPGDKKPSKYRNHRTPYNGVTYDSKREADRAAELDMLIQAGEIAGVARQVPFLLDGGIVYKADFVVLMLDGTYVIEDAKGVRTKEYKLKKRLMAAKGLEIREV